MTQKIKYSTLGFLFGSILFLSVSTFAANGSWSIGNGFMIFKQQGDSAVVNVGIGVPDPDKKLVVNGQIKSASTPLAETDGQVVTTVDYVEDYVENYFSGSEAWKTLDGNIYRDSGNVGIFTNNPTEKFEVNGTSRFLDTIKIGASDDISGNIGKNNSGIFLQASNNKSASVFNAEGKGLTVENSGNTNISNDLEVKGNIDFEKINWNNSKNIDLVGSGEYSFDFSENTGSSEFHITAPGTGTLFSVKSNGSSFFFGNMGIGKSPENGVKLDVNGGIRLGFSDLCGSKQEGVIRFDKARKVFEGCNGESWELISNISKK